MPNLYEYPDYLQHFGVKGMKWGVRKSTPGSSTSQSFFQKKAPNHSSVTAGRATQAKSKSKDQPVVNRASKRAHSGVPATSLSNKELQARINRLNMEQQYNRLTQSDPQVSMGRKAAKAALAGAGTVASAVAIKAIKSAAQPYANEAAKKGAEIGIDLIKRKVLN